ncbi:MAG: hypothetical protein DWC09_02010 [Candidatus Poseidoniales archaeon]|nr:MAG: hypothetical protein DWC09_02010 [Candidatus Poseidoniales archaeon]
MKSTAFALFALLSLLGAGSSGGLVQAEVIEPSIPLDEPVQSSQMGRSLLVEEVTTTWCPSCAEIDPFLMGVADAHGSRIAMVAYHPSDGEDAFQPEASQHRIDRLGLIHGSSLSTPTFFVEGENPRTGLDAWSDVQRDILDAELKRQGSSTLQFEVIKTENQTTAKIISLETNYEQLETTQLTFLVMQHSKLVPKEAINLGGGTRDRVVVATAECNLNTTAVMNQFGVISASVNQSCTTDFSITFENLDEFSVVLIHEHTVEAISNGMAGLGTIGTVELAFRTIDTQDSNSNSLALLALAAGAGVIAILPRKGSKYSQE